MKKIKHLAIFALLFLSFAITLTACGGDGGNGYPPPTATYTIGGTVTGLTGTGLVLQNNDADDLDITADGDFTFATAIADGSGYSVTVLSQPTGPSQTCTVNNGSGIVSGANITDVTVSCGTNSISIYVGDGDTEEYYIYGANEGLLTDYENWYSVDQAPSAILLAYAPNGGNLQAAGDYKFYIVASPRQIQVDAIELGIDTGIYLEQGASWSYGNLSGNIWNVYGEPDGLTVSVGLTVGGSGGTYSGFITIENY